MCRSFPFRTAMAPGVYDRQTSGTAKGHQSTAVRASLIQTLTVGIGISPIQPVVGTLPKKGSDLRVADYHRRFGLTPTPEHVVFCYCAITCTGLNLFRWHCVTSGCPLRGAW